MLIVAPTGSTKEVTSLETPSLFSVVSKLSGNVAALELVVKANNCTGYIVLIKKLGFILVNR